MALTYVRLVHHWPHPTLSIPSLYTAVDPRTNENHIQYVLWRCEGTRFTRKGSFALLLFPREWKLVYTWYVLALFLPSLYNFRWAIASFLPRRFFPVLLSTEIQPRTVITIIYLLISCANLNWYLPIFAFDNRRKPSLLLTPTTQAIRIRETQWIYHISSLEISINPQKIPAKMTQPSPLNIMTKPGQEQPASPATLSNLTICNSIKSDVSLPKDSEFWRHFSMAIHQDEEQARQPEHEKTES